MNSRLRALLGLLILSLVAWTYRDAPGFGPLPLADDDANIFFNPHLSAPNGAALSWMFTNIDYVHRYMPLGWLGFSLAYASTGLDPFGYHLFNLLLHALCAGLLFGLLIRILRRFRPEVAEEHRLLAAAAAAALWAVHPLRVESVATCSGLLYSQALFFALLAVHARLSELDARLRGASAAGWLVLGFAAYAASVLTYPVALFLPPALLILDLAWMGPRRNRALLPGFLLWGGAAALSLLMNIEARYTVSPYLLPASVTAFGFLPRILQACYVYALYLAKSVWPPAVSGMAGSTLFELNPAEGRWWLCAAAVLAVSAAAWGLRRRALFFGLAWLGFLGLLVPNLGFLEHPHTASDRYTYLPGCALALMLALALLRVRPAFRPAAWAACWAAAVGCSVLATRQALLWRNAPSFFSAVLAETRNDDIRAITVSRLAYLRYLGGDVRGGRESARAQLQRTPALGGVVLTWKQMEPAAPLAPEIAAGPLQEWPAAPWAVFQRQIGADLAKQGRRSDALAHFDAALAISPAYADARFARGLFLVGLGRKEALHDWLALGMVAGADRARNAYLASRIAALYRAGGEPIPKALLGSASGG